jgi:hypothetical protein
MISSKKSEEKPDRIELDRIEFDRIGDFKNLIGSNLIGSGVNKNLIGSKKKSIGLSSIRSNQVLPTPALEYTLFFSLNNFRANIIESANIAKSRWRLRFLLQISLSAS